MTAPNSNGKAAASHVDTSDSPETVSNRNAIRKTPESFLGPNSNLVNLDALVSTKTSSGECPLAVDRLLLMSSPLMHLLFASCTGMSTGGNPFASGSLVGSLSANPFQAAKPAAPTINQLRSQGNFATGPSNNSQSVGAATPVSVVAAGASASAFTAPTSSSGLLGGSASAFDTTHLPPSNPSLPSGHNPFSL